MDKKLLTNLKLRAKGFTLIELLIVITIIGILAVALLPRVSQGPAKARDVKRKSDLNNIATSIELYYSDNGEYPNSGSFTGSPEWECLSSTTGNVGPSLLTYMQSIPQDPGSTGSAFLCTDQYYYRVMPYTSTATTASSFALIADLELDDSASDSDYCDLGNATWDNYSDGTIALTDSAVTCDSTSLDAWFVILR